MLHPAFFSFMVTKLSAIPTSLLVRRVRMRAQGDASKNTRTTEMAESSGGLLRAHGSGERVHLRRGLWLP